MVRRFLTGGLALAALAFPAAAGAVAFAPVDQAGPALSAPQDKLDESLVCSPDLTGATRTPVLLVPGTGATADDNWSWTYVPALTAAGIPWCTVNPPDHSTGDLQVNVEYVVNAIRAMHAAAGRKIAIFGHSQGGMTPRYALRFWPDLRPMVDDLVGFAPSNHGTTQARAACADSCSASSWQQRDDSQLIAAVNSFQETFPGISYTVVYTKTDEIVQPNSDDTGSSSLRSGGGGDITNVATQDICPTDVYEHLMIGTVDPAAYALAIDALEHPGPADPARISLLVCPPLTPFMPGVDPVTGPGRALQAAADYAAFNSTSISAEPPLRCYMIAGACPPASTAVAAGVYNSKKKCAKKSRKKGHKHKHKRCKKKQRKHKRHR